MEKFVILLTSPDGADTTIIGTFEDEELADSYSKTVLEPIYVGTGSKIHITSITRPLQFRDQLAKN